ncbi:hypothetical protein [Haloarchaeobius sp. TZWWS8]|uniref:hypothetical protein n=1 Tax=Haloarchaeobius sp. TZWWS8 TaxID=3446121 RepID=UPI003EBDA7C4
MRDEDGEWPDPPTSVDTDVYRVGMRVGCSAVVAIVLLIVSREYLAEVLPLL